MLWRLALLVLFGMFLAWYKPSPNRMSVPPAAREAAPVALPERQIHERTGQCDKTARDAFRREGQEGAAAIGGGTVAADFTSHYNAKLDICFYLLVANGPSVVSKKLYDVDTRELYGEYLGAAAVESPPAELPKTCRVEGLFCASEREWDVLVAPYLHD